jgi:hypothetical protein
MAALRAADAILQSACLIHLETLLKLLLLLFGNGVLA